MITLTTYKWIPDFAQPLMRAMRVRWALEEAGMPYQVRTIAHDKRMAPDHVARQPFAQCPAIEEDGLTLFESGAIALYIAEQSEALMPEDRIEGARAIAWVFAALNSVEIAIQQLGEIDFFHKDAAWAKERRPMVEAFTRQRLGQLAQSLGDKDYLEGRFTIGDLMMADVLRILGDGPILYDFPTLKAYRDRCMARPAYLRAMTAQMDGFKAA